MKILAVTMGSYLQVFLNIYEAMQKHHSLEKPVIYVSDSANFLNVAKKRQNLCSYEILKEWELTKSGAQKRPDMNRLRKYQTLFDESLWNSLLCDRRIFFGRLTKATQDYTSHYSYEEMMGILDQFLTTIENFINHHKPNAILSFGSATIGDYIFELFAKQKKIPFLQLRPTKIRNFHAFVDSGTSIDSGVRYRFLNPGTVSNESIKQAQEYIKSVNSKGLIYEGVHTPESRKMVKKLCKSPSKLLSATRVSIKNKFKPIVKSDKHIPPTLRTSFYENIVQPLRALHSARTLPLLSQEDLTKQKPFIFYPLHFEPEVSLQVFGRPFQNQIEVVRNLALSAPVGMKILVKEHPRSLGFRKNSYYRKLLAIPNVQLINPGIPTINVVKESQLVAVVSGSVGLEAAICGKPVLIFGNVPYEILPESMVYKVKNLHSLHGDMQRLMKNYDYKEESIVTFIASIVEKAIPVNMYTDLLKKGQRFKESEHDVEKTYQNLATNFFEQLQQLNQ